MYHYSLVKLMFNQLLVVGYFLFDSEEKGSQCTGLFYSQDGENWKKEPFGKQYAKDDAELIAKGKAEIAKLGGINNVPFLIPKAKAK